MNTAFDIGFEPAVPDIPSHPSSVRLGNCIYFPPVPSLPVRPAVQSWRMGAQELACLVLDLVAELPHSADGHPLTIVFMAVDRQQQIGDQAGQNLNQHAVFIPGKQMVNVQMLFPPAEKRLDIPTKFVREHYLLRGQVETVGRNQVLHAAGLKTHNPNGSLGLLSTWNAKNHFGVESGR